MSNNGYVLRGDEVMDQAEAEIQDECKRLGIKNKPIPKKCSTCNTDEFFEQVPGMVGETMLICIRCKKILWTDEIGAIRSVF